MRSMTDEGSRRPIWLACPTPHRSFDVLRPLIRPPSAATFSRKGRRARGTVTAYARSPSPNGRGIKLDDTKRPYCGPFRARFGRQCPRCKRLFRMHVKDYHALPDDLRLTCPYCCADADGGDFLTQQQRARAKAAAGEYAQQLVARELDGVFSSLARKANVRRGGIRVEYSGRSRSVQPGRCRR